MFGQNCAFPCHCLNEKTCDQINGRCPDNLCAPGWKGDNCSTGRRLLYKGSYMSALRGGCVGLSKKRAHFA